MSGGEVEVIGGGDCEAGGGGGDGGIVREVRALLKRTCQLL